VTGFELLLDCPLTRRQGWFKALNLIPLHFQVNLFSSPSVSACLFRSEQTDGIHTEIKAAESIAFFLIYF